MGIPGSSLPDLIDKVKSWIFWRATDPTSLSSGFKMAGSGLKFCYECETNFRDSSLRYHCKKCARMLCGNCVQYYGSLDDAVTGVFKKRTAATVGISSCKFCSDLCTLPKTGRKYSDKIYPAESPRQSPEPPSPSCGESFDNYSPHAVLKSSMASFSSHLSPVLFHRSPCRYEFCHRIM
jgi:1-phosphatidylinositol-3-phosphate 5-kinase